MQLGLWHAKERMVRVILESLINIILQLSGLLQTGECWLFHLQCFKYQHRLAPRSICGIWCYVQLSGTFWWKTGGHVELFVQRSGEENFRCGWKFLPSCFSKWTLNFLKKAGHIDGEIMEMLWSGMNKVSSMARSMSKAHRQEVLDDYMRDVNWKKAVRIGDIFINSNGSDL